MLFAIFVHGIKTHNSSHIKSFISITTLPTLSLSNTYFEARYRLYSDYSNNFYPNMKPINNMDFVYAK